MLPDIIGYKVASETGGLQVIRQWIPDTLCDIHRVLNNMFSLGSYDLLRGVKRAWELAAPGALSNRENEVKKADNILFL